MSSKRSWDDVLEVALMAGIGYVGFCFYPVVSLLASRRGVDFGPWLHTRLDDTIPYWPVSVLSYLLAYVLPLPAAYIVLRQSELAAFRRIFASYLLLLLFHFAFYLAIPTSAGALMLPDSEIARHGFAPAIRLVYKMATSFNAFPSFHVASGWFFARNVARWEPRAGRAYEAWFWTMFASTCLIKIHWLADAAAGWLVAEFWFRRVLGWMDERRAFSGSWPDARLRVAAFLGPFLAGSAALWLATRAFLP